MTDRSRISGRRRPVVLAVVMTVLAVHSAGLVTCGQAQPQPQIRFQREHIRISVRPAAIRVDGTYFLRNEFSTRRRVPLFFPFPVDSAHPWPTHIVVYSQTGDTLPFERPRRDGIVFRVDLAARGCDSVRVVYEQSSLDHTACYILTTTSVWACPLERADFEVSVPFGVELESLNYDADGVVTEQGERVYRFRRQKFMPTKDLCVRWRLRR